MADKLGIASPWMTFAREVHKLFESDPDVRLDFDNDNRTLDIYVSNAIKADALGRLIPTEKRFGNVTVKVSVIPANEGESECELFRRAFAGNPAVREVATVQDVFGNDASYVVFEPVVVQFPNDNIGDVNGLTHVLYQDIAREVFRDGVGVHFCTGVAGDGPVTVWP